MSVITERKGLSAATDKTLHNDFLQSNINKNPAFSKYQSYTGDKFRVSITELSLTSGNAIFRLIKALTEAGVSVEIHYSSFDGTEPNIGGLYQ